MPLRLAPRRCPQAVALPRVALRPAVGEIAHRLFVIGQPITWIFFAKVLSLFEAHPFAPLDALTADSRIDAERRGLVNPVGRFEFAHTESCRKLGMNRER